MRPAALLLVPLAVACTTVNPAALAPQGTTVELGESVRSGPAVLTPIGVMEDSRCPRDVQCVWAGRVVLSVRVENAGSLIDATVVLGQKETVAGHVFTLEEVSPHRMSEGEIANADYRFRFSP